MRSQRALAAFASLVLATLLTVTGCGAKPLVNEVTWKPVPQPWNYVGFTLKFNPKYSWQYDVGDDIGVLVRRQGATGLATINNALLSGPSSVKGVIAKFRRDHDKAESTAKDVKSITRLPDTKDGHNLAGVTRPHDQIVAYTLKRWWGNDSSPDLWADFVEVLVVRDANHDGQADAAITITTSTNKPEMNYPDYQKLAYDLVSGVQP